MTTRIAQWTLDVQDVEGMARFWSAALGYRIEAGDDGLEWLAFGAHTDGDGEILEL